MYKFCIGTPQLGDYNTWPINSPNPQRLVFNDCCMLTYDRIDQTCHDVFEITAYGEYDGLGEQYIRPVIYADDNGKPGEKLSMFEPILDLTNTTPGTEKYAWGYSVIKNRVLEPGYYWFGVYAHNYRPYFTDYDGDGLFTYYMLDAPNGIIPEYGGNITPHPVGEICITIEAIIYISRWGVDFENKLTSMIIMSDFFSQVKEARRKLLIQGKKITDNGCYRSKACHRTHNDILFITSIANRILKAVKKLNSNCTVLDTLRKYQLLSRFITTMKHIHDILFYRMLHIQLEKILFSPITLIRFIREKIMNTVYKNQTALRLIVDTAIELGSGDVCEIRYCKPDGVTGSFAASILSENSSFVYYDINNETELDVSGWWKFWAYITFADGRSACGKSIKMYIADEGS